MYGTVQELMEIAQVRVEDIDVVPLAGQSEGDRLQVMLESFLLRAKDLVDQDRNRDYELEVILGERVSVPPGIEDIALRLAANMVNRLIERQTWKQVSRQSSEMGAAVTKGVFTDDILDDLSMYPRKPSIGLFVMTPPVPVEDPLSGSF